jgi:hypothetical protein
MKNFIQKYIWFVGSIGILALSYIAFLFPFVAPILFAAFLVIFIIAHLHNRQLGLALIIGELLLGGFGYLLFVELGGHKISLRHALFVITWIIFAYDIIRLRALPKILNSRYIRWYLAFIVIYLGGILIGLLSGAPLGNIFLDANGYLFYAYLVVFLEYTDDFFITQYMDRWLQSIIAVVMHSFFLLYIFSHDQIAFMRSLYRWTRDFRLGEITRLHPDTNFHRVFFQHHIWLLPAFGVTWIRILDRIPRFSPKECLKEQWGSLLGSVVFFTAIILTLSRSLWVGTVVMSIAMIGFVIQQRYSALSLFRAIGFAVMTVTFSFTLLWGIVNFPLPAANYTDTSDAFSQRFSLDEPAASSRWKLLPAMWSEIAQSPVIGYGLAHEITYNSDDPRIKTEENPEGTFTTFSFEWGYLDIWLKFGFAGLALFIAFLLRLLKDIWANTTFDRWMLLAALSSVAAVHIFTPYLNHPLGIGIMILVITFLTHDTEAYGNA